MITAHLLRTVVTAPESKVARRAQLCASNWVQGSPLPPAAQAITPLRYFHRHFLDKDYVDRPRIYNKLLILGSTKHLKPLRRRFIWPDEINKVVILGSGPAGLTAALYTARANLSPLLIEGHEPGGQLTITTDVENYPGFEHGIQGPEMMDVFRRQVTRFGTRFMSGAVTEVRFGQRPFELVADGKVIKAEVGDHRNRRDS